MGPPGSGQLTKMVNQICIGGLLQALAEAIVFTQRAGLDPDTVLATISKGAAQSWQMENRWPTMVAGKFDFGFAVDLMRTASDRAGRPVLPGDPGSRRWQRRHLQPDHQPHAGLICHIMLRRGTTTP